MIVFEISTTITESAIDQLITPDQAKICVESGLALMKKRITGGTRADGTDFAPYSDTRIYIPVAGVGTGSPLVKPRGGQLSRTGKTMRFDGGYAEFRAKAGRASPKPDFTLSGNTVEKRLRVLKVEGYTVIAGWPAGSTQALAALGIDARENGQVFAWSEREAELIQRAAAHFIARNIYRAGLGPDPGPLNLN